MAHIDIFNNDAFSLVEMTEAINAIDYKPQMLGSMNIFGTPKRVRTKAVSVELRNGSLRLIQSKPRGAPLDEASRGDRKIYTFQPPQIAEGDTLYADEIDSIRAFGRESDLVAVQAEIVARQSEIIDDVELTFENMRLGAVQGILTDADNSVIYNWFTEFGVTQPTEINFDLDNASPASGAIRSKCSTVIRASSRASKDAWAPNTYLVGLCGDTFFDQLVATQEVRETYLSQQEAKDLRKEAAFQSVWYGGIHFVNYRGTDDNSTVAVAAEKCKFFPVNAPKAWTNAFAPPPFLDAIGTPGQDLYSILVRDKDRNAWVRAEVYSFPIWICNRPLMLQSARNT